MEAIFDPHAWPAEMPLPQDLVSSFAAWLTGQAVKRVAANQPWESTARRAIPVLQIAVAAAVRVAIAAMFDGLDLKLAIARGLLAGCFTAWSYNFGHATVGGNVSTPPAYDSSQPPPPARLRPPPPPADADT